MIHKSVTHSLAPPRLSAWGGERVSYNTAPGMYSPELCIVLPPSCVEQSPIVIPRKRSAVAESIDYI